MWNTNICYAGDHTKVKSRRGPVSIAIEGTSITLGLILTINLLTF